MNTPAPSVPDQITDVFKNIGAGVKEAGQNKQREYDNRIRAVKAGKPLKSGDTPDDLLKDFKNFSGKDWSEETQPETKTGSTKKTVSESAPETAPEVSADQEPEVKLKSMSERFKQCADKFIRKHFKSEIVDEKPPESSVTQMTKKIGISVIGAAASLAGIKSLVDLPRWFAQKYYTKKEHARIQSALDFQRTPKKQKVKLISDSNPGVSDDEWTVEKIHDDGLMTIKKADTIKTVESSAIEFSAYVSPLEEKKKRLEQAINESKYVPAAKKAELLKKLKDEVEIYENELAKYEKERNEKIAKLLDETIQTRVKGTMALKEALNTALIATGLSALRGVGYGAVALYERHVKVQKEREKKERTGGYIKELIVNGVKETLEKLILKKGDTGVQKALNFGQALGTVMLFGGFAGLATEEMFGKGGPSEAINKALEAFEQKGVLQASVENYGEQFERMKDMATLGLMKEETTPPVIASSSDGKSETIQVEIASSPQQEVETNLNKNDTPSATEPTEKTSVKTVETEPAESEVAAGSRTLETSIAYDETEEAQLEKRSEKPVVEDATAETKQESISKNELQTGTVRKGDSFTEIAERHLRSNPAKFGYKGDLDNKAAVERWVEREAYRTTLRQAREFGIYGKGIDKLSINVVSDNGKLTFKFHDAKTGNEMPLEDARKLGFIRRIHKPTRIFEDTSSEPGVKAPEVSIEHLESPEQEKMTREPREPEVETQPERAPSTQIETEKPASDSKIDLNPVPELNVDLSPSAPSSEITYPEPIDETKADTAQPATQASQESAPLIDVSGSKALDVFHSQHGTAHFSQEGGRITGIKLNYTRTDEDINKAAERFATSKKEIHEAYRQTFPDKSLNTQRLRVNGLLGRMEEQSRTDKILKEMETKGQKGTPEYFAMKKHSGYLKGFIKRSFQKLGMKDKLEPLERVTQGIEAQTVPSKDLESAGLTETDDAPKKQEEPAKP
jgi:hypothetical protein